MNTFVLSNGVEMPQLIQGIPIAGASEGMSFKEFHKIVRYSIDCGVRGFDTSAAYGPSEEAIGKLMPYLNRQDLFITTKISNQQQEIGNIEECVDRALRLMNTDYIDCMLLHWPYPGYIENWKILEKEYAKGKLRSIGIANTQERHIFRLQKNDITTMPHVMQIEVHPFHTIESMKSLCNQNNITIQACSSLMEMRPLVRHNQVLKELASKYKKSIAQLILRWHIQRGVAPVFRAFSEKHILESVNVFDFSISNDDIAKINKLNIDYRLHPESMNCPGY